MEDLSVVLILFYSTVFVGGTLHESKHVEPQIEDILNWGSNLTGD